MKHNGNGNADTDRADGTPRAEMVPTDAAAPPWVVKMREAAMNVLTVDDVKQIVANQVAAAKKGDRNAIKFVFEQILGGGRAAPNTFIQNNYHGAAADDAAPPAKPTKALPGSEDKIRAMRRRVAAGLDACNGEDGPAVDLD